MSIGLPQVHLPSVPGPKSPTVAKEPLPSITLPEDLIDRFGLGVWAKDLTPLQKYYVGLVYKYFEIDPRMNPTGFFGVGAGTIPECVCFGWLLDNGYQYQETGPRGFRFQSAENGGREIPGGSVVDFEVFRNERRLGVRIFSVYHSLSSPYGGGRAVYANEAQRLRLLMSGRFDNVIDLSRNLELETGPDEAIAIDLERIETS